MSVRKLIAVLTKPVRKKLSEKSVLNVAIVGGGAGAVEMIIRLLEAGGGDIPITFTIFEPRDKLGRGIAWENETDSLIANMRLETLGPSYPEFELIESLLCAMGHAEAGAEYPSRNAMGDALDRRWSDKQKDFPQHWSWRHERKEVVDLEWNGKMATVIFRSGAKGGFDLVVLAIGNVPAKRDPHLPDSVRVINGWDGPAFKQIPADSDALIRGAGLTSIDATIRLLEQGHHRGRRSIAWHSRSGELPFIRPKQLKNLAPIYLDYANLYALIDQLKRQGKRLRLRQLKSLFKLEMASQKVNMAGKFEPGTDYQGFLNMYNLFRGPTKGIHFLRHGIASANYFSLWFSVAKLFDEYTIPLVWNALDDADKVVFLQKCRRDFDRFWAPIPVVNGRRIKDWLEDKTIQLLRGSIVYQADQATGKILFDRQLEDPLGTLSKQDLQERYADGFDVLIEAGGIPVDLAKLDSVIVENLCKRRYLLPYKLHDPKADSPLSLGAKIDWYSGAVLAKDDKPHGWLFSLTGSLTAGAHRFTNSYLAVSASANRVATTIMQEACDEQADGA